MSQNEQNENRNVDDILAKEIESWIDFRYALREEYALLFNKMLSECGRNKDYIKAVSSKGEYYSAESLFMLLVLQQRKMINELIAKVFECKKLQKKTKMIYAGSNLWPVLTKQ
ncbi:MAG: hypothetical protein WBP64_20510 [Nitrososphaeraceae archaeon]